MIKYERLQELKADYLLTANTFDAYFSGQDHLYENLKVASHSKFLEAFSIEFWENVHNINLNINSYLPEIYYNGIAYPYSLLQNIHERYKEKIAKVRNKRWLLIEHMAPLAVVAEEIIGVARGRGIYLTPLRNIKRSDYDLIGIYKALTIQNVLQNSNSQGNSEDLKFTSYLSEDGKKAYPIIKKLYKGVRPRIMAQALYAMKDLGLLDIELSTLHNQTEFTNSICSSFGKMSRQSLFEQLGKYGAPTKEEELKIQKQKERIKSDVENSNPTLFLP
ncbi:hypothetical protein [Cesiribacter sp. SM1]|uniref:hypothetical protein n=1 Tax=Cesiribacter sp. SM1 TaxID=2861196 RepID=UPI001CD1A662|nr:hypothetical protein [Cesiribacter sp. SM1]